MPRRAKERKLRAVDKAHILLVEDNPGVLGAISLVLKRGGYKVSTATSVAEAVQRAQENPDLDLVITDYHLSHGDTGRQVISAVRKLRGPKFKAVVITGDTSSAVHAFDGDACLCWLRKPTSASLLLNVLEKFTPHHASKH
jgi:CheY-like chemotaxis protein